MGTAEAKESPEDRPVPRVAPVGPARWLRPVSAPQPPRVAPVARPPDPDELLVAYARRGDRRALEKLLARHRPRVVQLARRVLRDGDAAEDVAQEVLAAVCRAIGDFRGGARFSTWLHRVATNHALNHLRAHRRRDRGEGRAAETAVVLLEEPAPPREREESRERVRAAIEALDPLFRTCILLRDVDGLSYEEIARRTGLPRGTVKSRIHRARARIEGTLRASLADTNAPDEERPTEV